MQPLELDEGGVAGGTAGQPHGPYFTPTARLRQARCVLATARRPRAQIALTSPACDLSSLIIGSRRVWRPPRPRQPRHAVRAAGAPRVYTATLPVEKMRNKQAVSRPELGDIVIELLPDAAPNHVGYFMKLAGEGAYAGTTFPSRRPERPDPGRRSAVEGSGQKAQYGTGGLGVLSPRHRSQHVRGAVSAVLRPGQPDSAGAQFFVCVSDQPSIEGQFTVFGRVVEGLEVAQQIRDARRCQRR